MPISTTSIDLDGVNVVDLTTTYNFQDGESYVLQNVHDRGFVFYADILTADPDPTVNSADALPLLYGKDSPTLVCQANRKFWIWSKGDPGRAVISPAG